MLKKTSFYPYAAGYYKIYQRNFAYSKDRIGLIKKIHKVQFIKPNKKNKDKSDVQIFNELCKKARIYYDPHEVFLYSIDILTIQLPEKHFQNKLGNLTVDYEKILTKGLIRLRKEIEAQLQIKNDDIKAKSFLNSLLKVLNSINLMRERNLDYLKKLFSKNLENQNVKSLIEIFSKVPLYPAETFKEALQSLLFINSLIWMNGHPLIGLGRLDQILYPYLKEDLENGTLTQAELDNLIKEFLKSINKYYEYKSSTLLGDTGQVIVLGGKNADGSDASNRLTFLFMNALKELKIPDPKIVLRVHNGTPKELWQKSFECIEEGLGYPLFSNDEIIINSLIEFGYKTDDAHDYSTSACWEPLIPGKSSDQNNIGNINFLEPLTRELNEIKNYNINNFEDFLKLYGEYLEAYIEEILQKLDEISFETSPLLSLLTNDCVKKSKDISEGGARYNYSGLLTLAMGNTVNTLLNIKRLVFEDKKIRLKEIFPLIKSNFESYEVLMAELQNKGLKYGMDNEKVINLTNSLIKIVQNKLKTFRNVYGYEYKFGLSSPAFIMESSNYPASFDGRKANEAFGVHISPIKTSNLSYSEIINFASNLSYEKSFNGNVVDIIVEKRFLSKFKDQFITFLEISFKKGIMQMQINILDPKILIEARKNPKIHPNLIVRVWGFSTYFNDLPNEYKDLIIERSLQYESIDY